MKTKNKQKRNYHNDCIMVTPFTIEECLLRMQAMANSDLEITVKKQNLHYAEVQFIERHKSDLAVYTISRLIPQKNDLTCITFDRIYGRHGQAPDSTIIGLVHILELLDKYTIGLGFLFWIVISVAYPQSTVGLFISLFIALSIRSLRRDPEIPSAQQLIHERKSREREQQRTDELKADVKNVLRADHLKTKIDEYDAVYYIEDSNLAGNTHHE